MQYLSSSGGVTPSGDLGNATCVPDAAKARWLMGAGSAAIGSGCETGKSDFGVLTVDAATMALQSQSETQEECPETGTEPPVGTMQCAPESELPGAVCASLANAMHCWQTIASQVAANAASMDRATVLLRLPVRCNSIEIFRAILLFVL